MKRNEGVQIGSVNFSVAHANKVSEEQFLKDHEHHADDVDLKAAYKQLRTKEATASKEPKK
jgi:hypothetical protein